MAKAKKPAVNQAEDKKELSREELMKQPGWSNSAPDSPQVKPVKSHLVKERIQE